MFLLVKVIHLLYFKNINVCWRKYICIDNAKYIKLKYFRLKSGRKSNILNKNKIKRNENYGMIKLIKKRTPYRITTNVNKYEPFNLKCFLRNDLEYGIDTP